MQMERLRADRMNKAVGLVGFGTLAYLVMASEWVMGAVRGMANH